MPKMRATARMPRGLLNRYRTRMMTAKDDTFVEPSARWSGFYRQYGWAVPVPDKPEQPQRHRGRPPKAAAQPEPEPEPAPETVAEEAEPGNRADEFDEMTNDQLRALAEEKGIVLPAHYVKNDDLIAMLKSA